METVREYVHQISQNMDAESIQYYTWETIKAIERSGQSALDFSNQELIMLAMEHRYGDVFISLMEMVRRGNMKMVHDADGVLCLEITENGQQLNDLIEPVAVNDIEVNSPSYDGFVESMRNIGGKEE